MAVNDVKIGFIAETRIAAWRQQDGDGENIGQPLGAGEGGFIRPHNQADPIRDNVTGLERARDVAAAFASIARSGALFASRGDDSGTHQRELALWDQAGIAASARTGAWYKATGSGMGATLNTASGLNAYVLADRASWLTFGNKGDLALLFAGDPALFNQYSFLPVNPSRHPHVKAAAAARLESWLLSERAKKLINGYMLNGVRLFTFNGR